MFEHTNSNMQALEPLNLPLDQNALIEASAGTGKTYTITTLYLRALLGLIKGKFAGQFAPLSIDQILVVTFTEAATQEIKDRVRTKLQEAQNALLAGTAKDPNLNQLLIEFRQSFTAQFTDKSESDADLFAYHRLQDAITLIDEASIFTIHGFCHRCLKQFAFETNSSFEQTFEMDAKPTLLGALQDFWRKQVSGLSGHEFTWFAEYWSEPDGLYQAIAEVLGKQVNIKPKVDTQNYQTLLAEHEALTQQVKQDWVKQDFTSAVANSGIKKTTKTYKQLAKVSEFANSKLSLMKFAKGDGWHLWSSETLQNASNFAKGAELFSHPLLASIDNLAQVESKLRQGHFQAYWLQQAKDYIEQRAGQLKTEAQIINPDDLLSELLLAINHDHEGNLIRAIQHTYPLAFIDEFQDTDPVQYGIFSSIYGDKPELESNLNELEGEQDEQQQLGSASMILIGDPKQAIYKFRGADIFTYIQAKQDIDEKQHYTLVKNYRSHPNLIKAVNACFSLTEDSFQHKQIPFINVGAGKDQSVALNNKDGQCANLAFWQLTADSEQETEKPKTGFAKGEAEGLLAKWCAYDIQQQLLLAKDNKLKIADRAVRPQDISVLVRNRHQASLVKKALSELGVAAVFISRDNVFKTELAKDLLRVLIALESPYNELKVRAASATQLFAADIEQLTQLNLNPELWQQRLDMFVQAHQLWSRGKVASAIKVLTDHAKTFTKWRNDDNVDANRAITDFRHLIELIQQQSVRKAGSQKLLLWFEQQVLATDNWSDASDEQQLRLESDNDLVQIATLHASKGLEYPIVYLPFITEYKAAQKAIYNANSDANPESNGLSYKVDNAGIEMQIAEHERVAEDLRLLYVAMTRPIHRLVLGLYNIQAPRTKKSDIKHTAIGQLLFAEQIAADIFIDDEQIYNQCLNIQHTVNQATKSNSIEVIKTEESIVFDTFKQATQFSSLLEAEQEVSKLGFTPFSGDMSHNWRMLSYSALAASHHHEHEQWLPGVSDEAPEQISADDVSAEETIKTSFSFPKGANAGSCLHWILENLDFSQAVHEQVEAIEQGLDRYGIALEWTDVVVNWMQQVLNTPMSLAQEQFALKDLAESNKLVEMEFYFSFEQLSPDILRNALLMSGIDNNQFNLSLFEDKQYLAGIVKGFIDLTFAHQGKFYVLDYKSNHLGQSYDDYQTEAMALAMSDHNYQLQALIYTLALHRFLQQRMNNYHYDQHIGGAVYLFLRGMSGDGSQDSDKRGVYDVLFKREVIEYLDNALLKNNALPANVEQIPEQTSAPVPAQAKVGTTNKMTGKAKAKTQANSNQMGFDFD